MWSSALWMVERSAMKCSECLKGAMVPNTPEELIQSKQYIRARRYGAARADLAESGASSGSEIERWIDGRCGSSIGNRTALTRRIETFAINCLCPCRTHRPSPSKDGTLSVCKT